MAARSVATAADDPRDQLQDELVAFAQGRLRRHPITNTSLPERGAKLRLTTDDELDGVTVTFVRSDDNGASYVVVVDPDDVADNVAYHLVDDGFATVVGHDECEPIEAEEAP